MSKEKIQVFEKLQDDEAVAFWRGKLVERQQFLSHVMQVFRQLPEKQYAINLCEDRYCFLVAFVACMLREQTCLLPPSRAHKEIERIGEIYADSYCLAEVKLEDVLLDQLQIAFDSEKSCDSSPPGIREELVAAIVFTSGSTGQPKANPKKWKELVASAKIAEKRFALNANGRNSIVATVPPQHMFGLETSIIFPLVTGACLHAGKPFFPQDINSALEETPFRRVLITTPLHLQACCAAGLAWPDIDFVVSATAPLEPELAMEAEKILQTEVREIYGCSEAGAIASRRTAKNSAWRLFDGYTLFSEKGRHHLKIPAVEGDIELADDIEVIDETHFRLAGRNSDMLKIGGKRGSLGDLNCKLKNIAGVEDAIFVLPDSVNGERVRLAALVVAPRLSHEEILEALAEQVDPVFLPRPLIKVNRLPYNELGKLPRHDVLALVERQKRKGFYLESA